MVTDMSGTNTVGNGQQEMFNCTMCAKSFKAEATARFHMKAVHVEMPQYGCIICEHKSKTKGDLKKHVLQVHTAKPETCELCKKVVKRLYRHNYKQHREKRFQCKICEDKFAENNQLKKHMSRHINEQHTCLNCPESFSSFRNLTHHNQSKHNRDIVAVDAHICNKCQKSFSDKGNLENHKKRVHVLRKFECVICSSKFKTNPDLNKHRRGHTKEKAKCDDCGKMVRNIVLHKKVHGNRDFKCNICEKDYKRKSHLSAHTERQHGKEVMKPCGICAKTFPTAQNLRIHTELVHMKRSVNACTICSREVKNMTRHLVTHAVKNSDIKCLLCTKKFKHENDMKNHINERHVNNQEFKCDFQGCKKVSLTEKTFKMHRQLHNPSPKTYKCTMCERSFKSESGRNYHKQYHTGERPYTCSICSFDCKDHGVLKRHNIHKHSDQMTYKCDVCKRTFYNEKNFTTHTNCTQVKENKLKCNLCADLFDCPSRLTAHQMIHANMKPHACNICFKSYTDERVLSKHMKTHFGQ